MAYARLAVRALDLDRDAEAARDRGDLEAADNLQADHDALRLRMTPLRGWLADRGIDLPPKAATP